MWTNSGRGKCFSVYGKFSKSQPSNWKYTTNDFCTCNRKIGKSQTKLREKKNQTRICLTSPMAVSVSQYVCVSAFQFFFLQMCCLKCRTATQKKTEAIIRFRFQDLLVRKKMSALTKQQQQKKSDPKEYHTSRILFSLLFFFSLYLMWWAMSAEQNDWKQCGLKCEHDVRFSLRTHNEKKKSVRYRFEWTSAVILLPPKKFSR